MPQKSLQKSSNKYLRQPFPENLTPNKNLGKREKYRPKLGLTPKISRMEREIYGGWLFFWNNLRKLKDKNKFVNKTGTGDEKERILLRISIASRNKITFPQKKLIAPLRHMHYLQCKGALGGNIIEHLIQSVVPEPRPSVFSQYNKSGPSNWVSGLEKKWNATCSSTATALSLGGNLHSSEKNSPKDVENVYNLIERAGSTSELCPKSPFRWGCYASGSLGFTEMHYQRNGINTPLFICTAGKAITLSFHIGEFVKQQISREKFHMIYSLQERWRMAHGKISDDYKKQLQERKKIAILYGNLSKKTLSRAMKRASCVEGNVAGHFLTFLERRLDVVLKRAFFFSSILAARQWICGGKILVNNQRQTFSGYLVQPADLISLSPSAKLSWKRHWLQLFNSMPVKNDIKSVSENTKKKPSSRFAASLGAPAQDQRNGSMGLKDNGENAFYLGRRFPFYPAIMKKWRLWSNLWSNSSHTLKKNHRLWHPIIQEKVPSPLVYSSGTTIKPGDHSFKDNQFSSYLNGAILEGASVLSQYFHAISSRRFATAHALAQRRETFIAEWLKRREKKPTSWERGWLAAHGNVLQAVWLHHQQFNVVDGLHMCRWNSIFAHRKGDQQRKKCWRFHSGKPMHLECSYKFGVIIFLYAPQKLVWPSTINFALLQKGLLR